MDNEANVRGSEGSGQELSLQYDYSNVGKDESVARCFPRDPVMSERVSDCVIGRHILYVTKLNPGIDDEGPNKGTVGNGASLCLIQYKPTAIIDVIAACIRITVAVDGEKRHTRFRVGATSSTRGHSPCVHNR